MDFIADPEYIGFHLRIPVATLVMTPVTLVLMSVTTQMLLRR